MENNIMLIQFFKKYTLLIQSYHACCDLCLQENCRISVDNTDSETEYIGFPA